MNDLGNKGHISHFRVRTHFLCRMAGVEWCELAGVLDRVEEEPAVEPAPDAVDPAVDVAPMNKSGLCV